MQQGPTYLEFYFLVWVKLQKLGSYISHKATWYSLFIRPFQTPRVQFFMQVFG